jgi:hypothetical protein
MKRLFNTEYNYEIQMTQSCNEDKKIRCDWGIIQPKRVDGPLILLEGDKNVLPQNFDQFSNRF